MIDVMAHLAKQRAIFHDEYHFRAWLARSIQQKLADSELPELEFTGFYSEKGNKLDMQFSYGGKQVAVETKFKKGPLAKGRPFPYESDWYFAPKSGTPDDISRYEFLRDIMRLESKALSDDNTIGCCLLLTNSQGMWKPAIKNDANDIQFRIDHGIKHDTLEWLRKPPRNTLKDPIQLLGKYSMVWRFFSRIPHIKNAEFWYLLVIVGGDDRG